LLKNIPIALKAASCNNVKLQIKNNLIYWTKWFFLCKTLQICLLHVLFI